MKTVEVRLTEIVKRVTTVEVPDNIPTDGINEYIENYIYGCIDDSYDWRVSDIVEDKTTIVNIGE